MLLGTDAIIYVRYSGSNALYFSDAASDLENNGLSNQHNLSITQADTDHDGINDGAEFNYWNITRRLPLSTAIEYCKNLDVDGDNITDGKEIYGYEVKIIVDWKSDGTPISRMRFISPDELDPLTPYANKTGVYTDSDEDGIPDIAESMLSNRSRWDEFEANYSGLWQKYSWISDYYNTIVSKENESAANEWLKSQFNPLIVDHTPPVITKFTIKWEVKYSLNWTPVQVYARVHLIVRDVGGISYLYILDEDSGESITYTDAGSMLDINHKFKASILTATFGSVKISIIAEDYAHNVLSAEKELKGTFEQVLDGLKSLWSAIWNTLVQATRQVAAGASIIEKWVIKEVEEKLYSGARIVKDNLKRYIMKEALVKPKVENIRELKLKMREDSVKFERDIEYIFLPYTQALYEVMDLIRVYQFLEGMMSKVTYILSESIMLIYSGFINPESVPNIGTETGKKMWKYLEKHIDVTSVDSYRRYYLSYAERMVGSNIELSKALEGDEEYKCGLIVGEYDDNIKNSVTHDVKELYNLLTEHGYEMIKAPGRNYNLQLSKIEIKELFNQLGEKLREHPNAKVFVAFLGHGWTNREEGGYVLYDGNVYLWDYMAHDFDYAVLDTNQDGELSSNELNNPPYDTMIMLFSTCFSRYANDAFQIRDFPQKRVLIAIADYNQESYGWDHPPISFIFFTGHFTNKLQGDWSEEFLMTLTQMFVGAVATGFLSGVISTIIPIGIFKEIAKLSTLKWLAATIAGIAVGALIFSAACAAYVYITAGGTIYDAANWGAKWASYGIFFGILQSSQVYVYNDRLAKEVGL